ncbi:MAG: hypothetical protein AAFY26_20055 [Cyanobacteria bacterium J06638_22]
MSEESRKSSGGKELVLSSVIGAVASIIAASISALAQLGLSNVDTSINIHWTMWIATGIFIYIVGCYVVESKFTGNALLHRVFKVPLWTDLRAFGEQPAAKASYWALMTIPIVAYLSKLELPWFTIPLMPFPLNFKLAYFASWFIAISLIVFAVFCPKELRRKNSLDKVRTVNLVLNNVEHPRIVVEQDEEVVDDELDQSSLLVRAICFGFYMLGTVAVIAILFRSAKVVFNA